MAGIVKPVGAVDFDGTLNTYAHGFTVPVVDPPIAGAKEWLESIAPEFQIVIFTARAATTEGTQAVLDWLNRNGLANLPVTITDVKPMTAVWFLDDRGLAFGGLDYPTVQELLEFRPWWQTGAPKTAPPVSGQTAVQLAASLAARAAFADDDVTDAVSRAAAAEGARLDGLEHRLKTPAALAGKVQAVAQETGLALPAAAKTIKDSLRYTVVIPVEADYVPVTEAILGRLAAAGARLSRLRNYWLPGANPRYADGTYLGVNAVLAGLDGFVFEVQFHTPQSLDVQAINWDFYRLIRSGQTTNKTQLQDAMRANNDLVPVPPGVAGLSSSLTAAGVDGDVDGTVPARVHYRESDDPTHSCATCSYYESAHCTMFDAEVEPSYVCDEWTVIQADHALGMQWVDVRASAERVKAIVAALPRRHVPAVVPVEHHNRVVAAGRARAEELEPKLARILEPILRNAGVTAARAFELRATDHFTASLVAAADIEPRTAMIALYPRPDEAAALAEPGGENPEDMHVTLAYLGEIDEDTEAAIGAALNQVAGSHPPLAGHAGGAGAFQDNGNGVPAIVLPDVPGLVELRQAACQAVVDAGADYARNHGYQPHLTVAYRGPGETHPPDHSKLGQDLHFDDLCLVVGNEMSARLPLTGAMAAAAGPPAPPPGWTPPAPDELLDVGALVSTLRTKTDPVRRAVVESVMKPALESAGIDFDVTNPLTAKVLAQSGSQIVSIAQTTQLNVMKVIKASYNEGLTIPDTARAIRAGMADASVARSTLIARTELVGAVNGGSVAATQIVAQATGATYFKQWLTAPGAQYPRHEDYDGLDGQTVQMDDTFEVGADQLQFPGDPDGSPEEVCNCRCTLVYTDSADDLTDAPDSVDS